MTKADVNQPDTVLASPGVPRFLDFTRLGGGAGLRNLGVDAEAVSDAAGGPLSDACSPGSALVVSHNTQLTRTDEEVAYLRDAIAGTATPYLRMRTQSEVATLLPGYELVEPDLR